MPNTRKSKAEIRAAVAASTAEIIANAEAEAAEEIRKASETYNGFYWVESGPTSASFNVKWQGTVDGKATVDGPGLDILRAGLERNGYTLA